jgi:subtilisin family serine protease
MLRSSFHLPQGGPGARAHRPAWCAGVALLLAGAVTLPAAAQAPAAGGGQAPNAGDGAVEWRWGPDVLGGYASDRIMLKLAPGASVTVDARGTVVARGANGAVNLVVTEVLGDASPRGAGQAWTRPPADMARARALGADRWHLVTLPPGTDVPALAERLMAADPASTIVEIAEIDAIGGAAQEAPQPNDPSYAEQWGMENVGQVVNGIAGASGLDVRARGAWHVSLGGPYSVVAVLDSGVNSHVDFADRMMPGWNVVLQNSATDDECSSHGTHVAGVIAAGMDNGLSVAGLAPEARILPVVVLNPCSGMSSWAADGLYWAVDSGATVANLSLQYNVGTRYFQDAVLYTVGAGVPVVAAAGNTGTGGVAWPARWPEVIAVGSLDSNGNAAGSSAVGPEVDVAAPGVSVLSTVNIRDVALKSGTSMACPHVAATVALMKSVAPALSIEQLRGALEGTCVDVQAPGVDQTSGHGLIDAAAAVRAARNLSGLADLDHDGSVGGADLGMLLAAWGECGVPCPCDLTDDGVVNGADLGLMLSQWGAAE